MVHNRAVWADLLRIFAMFSVVYIHLSSLPPLLSLSNILYFINYAVVKTCIALFFMLSGAFLLSKEESYKTFFQKRLMKVIFPWLVWTIIYMIVQVFLQCKVIKTVSEYKYFFELTLFTKFWILPVLAGLYLLTPALRILVKHARERDLYYLLTVWFIICCVLPFLHNGQTFPIYFPAGIFSQVMMCSGFFLGGYVLLQVPRKYITVPYITGLIIGGLLVTLIAAFLKSNEKVIDIDGFAFSIFSPGLVLLATGIFLLFHHVEKRFATWADKTKHTISLISIASFGVYLTHELLYDLAKAIFINTHFTYLLQTDLLTTYLRVILLFSLATLIVMGIQKIPYLRRIVP